MDINDVETGFLVQSGLCYGYSDVTNSEVCGLPLMVAEVLGVINDTVEFVQVINEPKTYVNAHDIHGIPLNSYVLEILGFKPIEKELAKCPGSSYINGQVYEATISNTTIQIIKDSNKYKLCVGISRSPIDIYFVHDIQREKKTNKKPLKINYMLFYTKK